MDRNSIIGLVLIFGIIATFAWLNQPNEEEIRQLKHKQDSLALVKHTADSTEIAMQLAAQQSDSIKKTDTAAILGSFGSFASASIGTESFTTIENEEIKATLTNKGGRLYSVELKKHKRYDGTPLVLFTGNGNEFSYSFATTDAKSIQTKDLFFTPVKSTDGKTISMVMKLADNQYIEQLYSLGENANMVDYKLNVVGMEKVIAPSNNYLDLTWQSNIEQQEKNWDAEHRTSTIYFRHTDDEPDYISESKDEKKDLTTPVQWISYKQQYFNASLIANESFKNATLETATDQSHATVKRLSASITIPYNHTPNESFGMKFYFGPNHYKTLAKLDIELERIVPMGWGIFRWVNKYLVVNVFYFLSQYIGSFGIIIFLLTLIVKTILFPLVYRSYLSAAKMRVLKPEIDEIKEKYGNDLQRTQQENMKLYRKAGVNPLGGCVPVLLQMPILIAMFQFFPSAFELRQQAFLWATDLSTYDSILTLPFKIPGYGDHVSLFALLMTISSVVYAIYNNENSGMTGQMKWMSYIMPVVFLFVLNSYAAGLNYYYFVSNLFTIGQQLTIRRFVDDKALHAQLQENKKKPVKKSRLEQKLEDMAKKRGIDPKQLPKRK